VASPALPITVERPRSLLAFPTISARSAGIDCLRGAFATWVLLAHLLPWSVLAGATPGPAQHAMTRLIDLFQRHGETHPAVLGFIVLSGYCIHRNGFRAGDVRVRSYAIRRVFRIAPVYVLATVAGALLFLNSHRADPALASTLTGTPHITASGLLVKLAALGALVPSEYAHSFQGNAPLVTVAAEMWLYLVYAAVVVALLQRGLERRFWIGIGVVWLIGLAWVSRHPEYAGWWHIGSLLGFLPYWWLGAQFVDPQFVGRRREAVIAAALGWCVMTLLINGGVVGSLFAVEARKLLLAVVIGAFIGFLDRTDSRVLTAGATVGRAGYSIYAFHAPILVALLVAGAPWPVCAAVALAVALVAFRVYEWPLTRYGAIRARRLDSAAAAAATVPAAPV
jgi:peptidoglycan/LPS O-acetylase OafA/YrhL